METKVENICTIIGMYWVFGMSDMVYRKWLFYMYMYWVPGMSDKNWFLRVEGQRYYRRIVFFLELSWVLPVFSSIQII